MSLCHDINCEDDKSTAPEPPTRQGGARHEAWLDMKDPAVRCNIESQVQPGQ